VLAVVIGVVALVAGTLGWALLRRSYGLPAFGSRSGTYQRSPVRPPDDTDSDVSAAKPVEKP
jgi:hypothetical protein